MPQAEDFLRFLSFRLIEEEGLDRVPEDAPFRAALRPIFAEILCADRALAFFVLADDRPLEECRRALDVFEQMREKRVLPLGLQTIVVTFVHGRRCAPERLQELAGLRPVKDVAEFRVEARVIDVEALRVVASAGWMSQGRPPVAAMEKVLGLWADGAGREIPAADLDRAVDARHAEEERFLGALQSSRPRVTFALLAVIGVVFLAMTLAGGSTRSDLLIRFGAKVNSLIRAGQVWRLFSCTCLHIGIIHLLFNGYGLWAVGPTIEQYFGTGRFVVLYFFAGLTGSLASFLFTPGMSAGASGALFGLLGAVLIMGWRHATTIPRRIRTRLVSGLGTVLMLNAMLGMSVPGIDNYAHAGGFLGGALAALFIGPKDAISGRTTGRPKRTLYVVLCAVPAVALLSAGVACVDLGRDPLAFPTRVFTDPSGVLEIDYPALLEPAGQGRDGVLEGAGMQVRITSEGFGRDPVPDLDGAVARAIATLARRDDVRAERLDTRTIGGREWAALGLATDGAERGRALVAVCEGRLVRLVWYAPAEMAEAYAGMLERMAATVREAGR